MTLRTLRLENVSPARLSSRGRLCDTPALNGYPRMPPQPYLSRWPPICSWLYSEALDSAHPRRGRRPGSAFPDRGPDHPVDEPAAQLGAGGDPAEAATPHRGRRIFDRVVGRDVAQ